MTRRTLLIGHQLLVASLCLNRTTEDSYTSSQLVAFLRPAINRRAT